MYLSYTTRSLTRGGSRTILALFCVAVGVMAIVALQLVGLMANAALTSNVREINGGDIAVSPNTGGFTQNDLQYFASLKSQGKIVDFTAYNDDRATDFTQDSRSVPMGLRTVNTSASDVTGAVFPLVGNPQLDQPSGADFRQLLSATPKTIPDGTRVAEKCPNTSASNAVVTKTLSDELGGKVGDIARITTTTHQVVCVVVAGVLVDQGAYSGGNPLMIVSRDAIPVDPKQPATYNVVNITTTTPAQAAQVKKDIVAQFPGATATTADDALAQAQQQVDIVRKFLQIVGLLALLIGGVGIINTMQVMLRRRRIEIAMIISTV
jgi:predicted lysophospholipase L1 biosynthesis ABC-type transport system permease subunit